MAYASPFYDLEATVSESFLNRILNSLIQSGLLPTTFVVEGGWRDGRIEVEETHRIDLAIVAPAIFAETGNDRQVGLRAEIKGKLTVITTIGAWQIQTPAGTLSEPGLVETFEVPFTGKIEAIGQIEFVEIGSARHAVVSFSRLQTLRLGEIGPLQPGPNFTEKVRRIIERIAIVEFRLSFMIPNLRGLPIALPAPLHSLINAQSGEIGLVDFKVTDTPGGDLGDDFHVLLQAKQNLGYQHYDLVHPRTDAKSDIALTVTSRWLREVQLDFWQGGVIPRNFADNGKPDAAGPIEVTYLGVTPLSNGALRIRTRAKRTVLGVPIQAEAMLEILPYINGNYLRFKVLDEDVNFEWAKRTAYSMLFFVLYELVFRLLIRGFNLVLAPWIETILIEFIQKQRIRVDQEFTWSEARLTVGLNPVGILIQEHEFGLTAQLTLTSA